MITRKIQVKEDMYSHGIPIQNMKQGDAGVTISDQARFRFVGTTHHTFCTVLCGKNGDIIFLEDGDIFKRDTSRLDHSTIRVRLLAPGTEINFVV